ncbi:MAG: DNA methyltransferase [Treponematales bacterium]
MTVLKYPGSKNILASWIVEHFPPDYREMMYLEPYFGSGAVFFAKEPSMVETINDLNGDVVNLFRQIRDNRERLAELVAYTPWSREEYDLSFKRSEDETENARRFLVKAWMSIGNKAFVYKNGMRMNVSMNYGNIGGFHHRLPDGINAVCGRFFETRQGAVQIENKDALALIKRYDRPDMLMYLDPPYVLSTRRGGKTYAHEYGDDDHRRLLEAIAGAKAKVVLSGYGSPLYDEYLSGWHVDKKVHFDEGRNRRVECLWRNYNEIQVPLFSALTRGEAVEEELREAV